MEKVLTEILPFEEWKEKLVSVCGHSTRNHDVCYYQIDGRTMIVEDTQWPHFGQVMASVLDPKNHSGEPKVSYSMTYVDSKGEYCMMNDEETYEPTGKTVTEEIDGLGYVGCYYYTAVVHFEDWDKACLFGYELYCRRRRFGLEIIEE
jgi:hypothetical protein